MTHSKIDSPCINVCALDAATQMCVGCFRTIEEITAWMAYSDAQRARVRGQLAARRSAYHQRDEHSPGRN